MFVYLNRLPYLLGTVCLLGNIRCLQGKRVVLVIRNVFRMGCCFVGSLGGSDEHVQVVGKLSDDALHDFCLVHSARHLPKPGDLGLVHGNLNKTNRKLVLALAAGHEEWFAVLSLLHRNLMASIAIWAVRHNWWLIGRFSFGLPRGFGS